MVLLIVGIIVVGPKRLPGMMRTAGQWIARIRRMSTDLRTQSGIDELIRAEGLQEHLKELRELRALSRSNVLETFVAPAIVTTELDRPGTSSTPSTSTGSPALSAPAAAPAPLGPGEPLREREYPLIGCDSYDALPDDMIPYTEPAAVTFGPQPQRGVAS